MPRLPRLVGGLGEWDPRAVEDVEIDFFFFVTTIQNPMIIGEVLAEEGILLWKEAEN